MKADQVVAVLPRLHRAAVRAPAERHAAAGRRRRHARARAAGSGSGRGAAAAAAADREADVDRVHRVDAPRQGEDEDDERRRAGRISEIIAKQASTTSIHCYWITCHKNILTTNE